MAKLRRILDSYFQTFFLEKNIIFFIGARAKFKIHVEKN